MNDIDIKLGLAVILIVQVITVIYMTLLVADVC